MDDATNAHRGCLQDAFGDHIAHLCEEAAKICQQSDAHRDLCARLADACQTLTATP
ncbi:MAG TPA: hypothetical protein VFQ61_01655 [Polyangiaceae bacterium]|nr:hypothetical protein [Polyangiaceae bacterium]